MTIRLEPKSAERLTLWLSTSHAEYITSRVRAGETPVEARASADQSLEAHFPGGVPAKNHHVYDLVHGETVVGSLWIGPHTDADNDAWWVWDVTIDTAHQGKGFGREAMALAEAVVRQEGGHSLGLNVFGYNTAAWTLYESLGYQTTAIQMLKVL
ncbi:N-acetyltransferase [Homoserinimonas sp. OAct 916]|uniref:GNAT family N-acetyltransferase n=1 Tax=Homoserinimonas sp. OAct 916 TaxID=2211450 RepID=UPI000DBE3671|nr:GNAT family N-acetyltransferase [Homoserinimonas sp. OAct 916]